MANSSVTFSSRGTRIFHGKAFGAIPVCRFVTRALVGDVTLHGGQVTLGTGSSVPCGVSPATFGDYVRCGASGYAAVESTPGTPTAFAAGVQLSYDATTHIADIELSF